METQTQKKPILDHTGNVRKWLEEGRCVQVWESQDLSHYRPEQLTPYLEADCETVADNKPHWAYARGQVIDTVGECIFYEPCSILRPYWTDTPAGHKAAKRAIAKLPDERLFPTPENPGFYAPEEIAEGPIFSTVYTLHTFEMVSVEGGDRPAPNRADGVPLCVAYHVGILQWSAKLR